MNCESDTNQQMAFLIQIYAKPFLKNPFQGIVSLATSSSDTNIADLRRKSDKIQQLSKHQNPDDDFFLNDDRKDIQNKAVEMRNTNEALPDILQKKIAKIMQKLHFIQQLISVFNKNDDKTVDPEDEDFDENETADDTTTIKSNLEFSEIQKLVLNETPEEPAPVSSSANGNKYDISPSGAGLYFMELLGSIFGLIYGATIQISNAMRPKPSL